MTQRFGPWMNFQLFRESLFLGRLSRRLHGPTNPVAEIRRRPSELSACSEDFKDLKHAVKGTFLSFINIVLLKVALKMREILLASLILMRRSSLPMFGQSSPVSPKRRMSFTPFSPTSIVPFSSTPSTSVIIIPPVSPVHSCFRFSFCHDSEEGKLCSVMRKLCRCLFSDIFAQNFSWTNVRQHGRKLKGSSVVLVIRGMAFKYLRTISESMVNSVSLNVSINAVDTLVRKWFKNTRDRSGGRADKTKIRRREWAPVNTSLRNALPCFFLSTTFCKYAPVYMTFYNASHDSFITFHV
ncbi:hypothetical protein AHF37_02559 [Paragonimus kellicotti]|nr:hypothetical protein AHF37_02559 [Paragonimus kellicotti]